MLPHTEDPALRKSTGRGRAWLTAALLASTLGVLVAVGTASGQSFTTLSLTVGAAEIRSGQHHRQDAVEVEALLSTGWWLVSANAGFRHGANDNDNRPWPPFMAATTGPRLGPLALVAGLQSYPWSVGTWTPLAGPRLDVTLGHGVSLHLSHLWRREGLVGTRMTRWTAATRFRLDYLLIGR